MATSRAILHVDMDAFFASIAQLDDPSLRGKPVLTGGTGPRAVVTTASYEARPFGCRSAMPMAEARRRCPQAIVVQVPGSRIREVSHRLFEILHEVTPVVQPVSVDEAFLDVTGSERLLGDPVAIARRLQTRIFEDLKISASVGVSHNKFLAKLASDLNKPAGLTVIRPEDVDVVLPPLEVGRIWGIGPATLAKLEALGIKTIGDLRRYGPKQLERRFGDAGAHWRRLAHGLDDRVVHTDRQAKSISQEQTFGIDVGDPEQLRWVLLGQADHVAARLRRHGLRAGGVTLKLRTGDFHTVTRSKKLDRLTDESDVLRAAAGEVFENWRRERFAPLRLIGVGAERLSAEPAQLELFPDEGNQKRRNLDATVDRIVERFGKGIIQRGAAPR